MPQETRIDYVLSCSCKGLHVKQARKERYTMDAHFHPYYEMNYLMEGERLIFVRNRTYHMTKGDLILIPCNELHRTMDAKHSKYEKLEICFLRTFLSPLRELLDQADPLAAFEREVLLLRLDSEGQRQFTGLFFQLADELKQQKYGYMAQACAILFQTLMFAERIQQEMPRKHPPSLGFTHARATDMIRYVNQNYQHQLTLGMLAERYHYHASYVSMLFKQITGFSFSDYLNQMRVKASQQMLQNTDKYITDICMECGFNSLSNYGRVFKRIVGRSPSEYRISTQHTLY